MKYFACIFMLVVVLLAQQCSPVKQVAYELPVEMAEGVKADYAKQCDKGKILYDINCSRCHTKKVKGKEVIPDFTADQLRGYELRLANARHEVSLSDSAITEEELGLVMIFLTYKKKNLKK